MQKESTEAENFFKIGWKDRIKSARVLTRSQTKDIKQYFLGYLSDTFEMACYTE